MRIKAYALFITIVISFLVFGLISSLIISNLLINKTNALYRNGIKEIQNCISGVYVGLVHPSSSADFEVSLFENEESKVHIKKKKWGCFEVVSSTRKSNQMTFTKSALVGEPIKKNHVLHLESTSSALKVCGNTKIKGNCILPLSGVQRGSIEGIHFNGTKTIDGSISTVEQHTPQNNELYPHFSRNFLNTDSVIFSNQISEDTIENSFSKPTLVVIFPDKTNALTGYYFGNILIFSEGNFTIGNDCYIQDAIVAGKNLTIENYSGSGQFHSSGTINCVNSELEYPSILLVNTLSDNEKKPEFISIEKSTIYGGIYYKMKGSSATNAGGINISSNSIIVGEVISNSWIDLSGKIFGFVRTAHFLTRTISAVYINHLLNCTISTFEHQKKYPLRIKTETGEKKILKWVL